MIQYGGSCSAGSRVWRCLQLIALSPCRNQHGGRRILLWPPNQQGHKQVLTAEPLLAGCAPQTSNPLPPPAPTAFLSRLCFHSSHRACKCVTHGHAQPASHHRGIEDSPTYMRTCLLRLHRSSPEQAVPSPPYLHMLLAGMAAFFLLAGPLRHHDVQQGKRTGGLRRLNLSCMPFISEAAVMAALACSFCAASHPTLSSPRSTIRSGKKRRLLAGDTGQPLTWGACMKESHAALAVVCSHIAVSLSVPRCLASRLLVAIVSAALRWFARGGVEQYETIRAGASFLLASRRKLSACCFSTTFGQGEVRGWTAVCVVPLGSASL